jgi:hypothetical protein
MIKLFSPDTEIDLAILKSLLEAEKIHYYVKNDHFGSLRPGPQIYLFNDKTKTSAFTADRAISRRFITAVVCGFRK